MKTVKHLEKLFLLITLIITILLLFRTQISNGFNYLSGDFVYDNIIHTSILEHWFNVIKGKNTWSEVGYFYPYKKTIAQTDAYFLMGMIYSIFRSLNFDPFLSTEITNLILKVIGFFGAFFLSKKILNNHWLSLILAVMFTLNNASTIHIYRVQLNAVAFIPFLILILLKIFESLKNDKFIYTFLYSSTFGSFLGLLAFSSFYITFFFILFLFIFLFIYLVLSYKEFIFYLKKIILHFTPISLSFIATGISFLPFVTTFLPKSKESGVKQFPFFALFDPVGLIQMGKGNYVWGQLYENLLNRFLPNYKIDYNFEYHKMGFSPLLLILFTISLLWLIKNKIHDETRFILSLSISFLVSILFIVKFGDFSLWLFIYNYFYGAKALTVVPIFTLILILPLLITIFYYFSKIKINSFVLVFILLFMIIFELNKSTYNLDRKYELSKYSNFKLPTISCSSFFVGGWEGQEVYRNYWEWINNQYGHNVSALYISQKIHIPTINGMASFIPQTYDLVGPNGTAFSPHSQEYLQRVKQYISNFNLKNVCYLNLNYQEFEKFNED